MNRYALSALLLAVTSQCLAANVSPWPVEEKKAAIASCRASIYTRAEQDYLKKHNLKELPARFREKTASAMEPFLATCECVIGHFEKKWSMDYYTSHEAEVLTATNALIAGACSVKPASQ